MNAKDLQRMRDMVSHAAEAIEMLDDGDGRTLAADRKLFLAISRLVEIVGEAASRVSAEARSAHAQVKWQAAAKMRNILAHDYGQVDVGILADTIHYSLPTLIAQVTKILEDETP